MPAQLVKGNAMLICNANDLPIDSLSRDMKPMDDFHRILPLMAQFYDPDWMKAPLIIDHDNKVEEAERNADQFTLGYFQSLLYDESTGDLWGVPMGTPEAQRLAAEGKLSSGCSMRFQWLTKPADDGTIILFPYLMHVALLGKDQPAMPSTSSISDAFSYSYTITKTKEQIGGFTMAETPKEPDANPTDTPPAEPQPTEIPSDIISLLDRKALGKLSQAVTDAVKSGGDVSGAKAKMGALLAATLKEIQALCDMPADEGAPPDEPAPDEGAQSTALKALQEENLKLRDLILDDKLAQVSLSDSDKNEFKAGLGTVPLETALKMLDLSIGQALRAGTPTQPRFTAPGSIAPTAPKEPKDVAELDAMQPAGFAAYLRQSFAEFANGEFDAEQQFKIKRADLLRTANQK